MSKPVISLLINDTQVSSPDPEVIRAVLDSVFPRLLVAGEAMQFQIEPIPALGEYWPGQGGINAGFVPERDGIPAHYLIFAADDIGLHKWGGYGKESGATSKRDGLSNTLALIGEGGHQAAEAALAHTADGHSDFYLPSQAELTQGWLNCPEIFEKARHWSSTQYSAYLAFGMGFEDGWIGCYGKDDERRVRPARRHFIQ